MAYLSTKYLPVSSADKFCKKKKVIFEKISRSTLPKRIDLVKKHTHIGPCITQKITDLVTARASPKRIGLVENPLILAPAHQKLLAW